MKKRMTALFTAAMLFAGAMSASAEEELYPLVEPYEAITVVTPPDKTVYRIGEPLDLSGLTLEVRYYRGGAIAPADIGKYEVLAENVSPAEDTKNFDIDTAAFDKQKLGTCNVRISLREDSPLYRWYTVPIAVAVTLTSGIAGDANGDGNFGLTDLVTLEKWLLGFEGAELNDWKAADLNGDNRVTAADLSLMICKRQNTPELNPPAPTTPLAGTLRFKNANALLAACAEPDLSQYPETAQPYYEEMFQTVLTDGKVYAIAQDDEITVLHGADDEFSVCPPMAYEDTGIFYHVQYKGVQYLVMVYYADPEILAESAGMSDYLQNRMGWASREADANGRFVSLTTYGENTLVANAFFDENNYFSVRPQSDVTEEELLEFAARLRFTVSADLSGELPHPAASILFCADLAGCTPRTAQDIALKCYTVYERGKEVAVDVMMGDQYDWNSRFDSLPNYETYGVNGYPALRICEADTLRYEPTEVCTVRINGETAPYEKIFAREEMPALDISGKHLIFSAYHRETALLNFDDAPAGSMGCIQFRFCWQYLDPPNPLMPSEGFNESLYYYVDEKAVVFSYSDQVAKSQYEALFGKE